MKNCLTLCAGLACLLAAWIGPLPALAETRFAAHMAIHVLVVAVASPLLACAIVRSRLFAHHVATPFAALAAVASALEFVVVWAWHTPDLHHAARNLGWVFALEQISYLAVGLLIWITALGAAADRQAGLAGVAALLFTSMHMALLGVLMASAERPLFDTMATADLTVLQDQQLGGVIMLAVGGISYMIGGLYLLAGLLADDKGISAVHQKKADVRSAR